MSIYLMYTLKHNILLKIVHPRNLQNCNPFEPSSELLFQRFQE